MYLQGMSFNEIQWSGGEYELEFTDVDLFFVPFSPRCDVHESEQHHQFLQNRRVA